jgi:hypothetical protein
MADMCAQSRVSHHAKCPFLLTDFKQNCHILIGTIQKFTSIELREDLFSDSEVVTCAQRDMTKVIGAFCKLLIVNAPK